MATGLQIPVGVDGTGGANLVSGDDNDRKIIGIALADDDNENAFQQDITLGSFMIFQVNDEVTDAAVLRRLRAIFRVFRQQSRFRLVDNTVTIKAGAEEGERELEFKYVNLESDEEVEARVAISGGGFRLLTVGSG